MLAAAALRMDETLDPPEAGESTGEGELLARCRADDPAAFRELYLAHRHRVWGVVARMISNEADREEVVQEVFLQVFRSLSGFKRSAKLSTWVHRVAVNVTLQHIRKKGRRVKLHLMESPPPAAPAGPSGDEPYSPEEGLLQGHRREAVERILESMAPKKRVVLVLADFMGKSSREISEIVDTGALTVRTRLFYARKEFYGRLSREPSFDGLGPFGDDE